MASVFDHLPDDAIASFLTLENFFRNHCESRLAIATSESDVENVYAEYVSDVIAAVLELDLASDIGVNNTDVSAKIGHDEYIDLRRKVGHFATRMRIRQGRASKNHSAKLDNPAKTRIRALLGRLRSAIENIKEDNEDKIALLVKLSALETQVEESQVKWETVSDLWIGVSGFEDGEHRIPDAEKSLNSIAAILYKVKSSEMSGPSLALLKTKPAMKRIGPPED